MRNYSIEQRPLDRTSQMPIDRLNDRTVRFPHTEQMPALSNFLLKSLPFSSLRRLQPHIKKVTLTAGEFICRLDETVEWIYFPETHGRELEDITGETALPIPPITLGP